MSRVIAAWAPAALAVRCVAFRKLLLSTLGRVCDVEVCCIRLEVQSSWLDDRMDRDLRVYMASLAPLRAQV